MGSWSRLRAIVGDEYVVTDETAVAMYAHDGTFVERAPDVVVRPASTAEVAGVVRMLYESDIPITPRGAGTGLSGGAVPINGGAVLSLDRLTQLKVDPATLLATAGAGVITEDLKSAAASEGLFYPPDPASFETCTIGGNIATNAGGPSCMKYGVTSEYVQGLTAVLAPGKVVSFGGRTRKKSSGYRLAQLLIGSEGTLGVVTEASLRLIPMPSEQAVALAAFRSVTDAARAVSSILAHRFLPAALELIDSSSLQFVHDLLPPGFPIDATAVLLIEQDGHDAQTVSSDLGSIVAIARAEGAYAIELGLGTSDRTALWTARRSIGKRLIEKRAYRFSEDICVPISRIPEMVERINGISASTGIEVAIFGHAGDGNLHPSLLFDDRSSASLKKVAAAASEILVAALELGGTVSAEHGLGATKREFAAKDLGEDAVEIMASIKHLLDPKGLLNPGKVFPSTGDHEGSFLDQLPGWLTSELQGD